MDELSQNDFIIIDEFVGEELYALLRNSLIEVLPEFKQAGVGSLDRNVINEGIRSDHTWWLDRTRDLQLNPLWALIDELMFVFNRYCFLGLSGSEFHFANYPPGGHYARHLDQFQNRNNRIISVIIYLNENWKKGDGGELEIERSDGSTFIVEPLARRCVMFKSAVVPHSVLVSHKNRFSLTGWLLHRPAKLGQLFG